VAWSLGQKVVQFTGRIFDRFQRIGGLKPQNINAARSQQQRAYSSGNHQYPLISLRQLAGRSQTGQTCSNYYRVIASH
jgi:hypothetical protein